MARCPDPIGPTADGSRIILAVIGLAVVSMSMMLGALIAWGAL